MRFLTERSLADPCGRRCGRQPGQVGLGPLRPGVGRTWPWTSSARRPRGPPGGEPVVGPPGLDRRRDVGDQPQHRRPSTCSGCPGDPAGGRWEAASCDTMSTSRTGGECGGTTKGVLGRGRGRARPDRRDRPGGGAVDSRRHLVAGQPARARLAGARPAAGRPGCNPAPEPRRGVRGAHGRPPGWAGTTYRSTATSPRRSCRTSWATPVPRRSWPTAFRRRSGRRGGSGHGARVRPALGGRDRSPASPLSTPPWPASPTERRHRVAGQFMQYTSGTTGRPKGGAAQLPSFDPETWVEVFSGNLLRYGIEPGGDAVHLVTSPMYHMAPLSFGYFSAHFEHPVVLMEKWDAEEALQLIERTGSPTRPWCRRSCTDSCSSPSTSGTGTTSRRCAR